VLGRPKVHPAHAAKIRMIANSMEKNDHNDAWWLAYLTYEGRLPEAYVAEGDLRELKKAGRVLRRYTDLRSDLVRRVRSTLAQLGKKLKKGWHTSAAKLAESKALLDTIPGTTGEKLQDLYEDIAHFTKRIEKWRKKVEVLCKPFPEIGVIKANMPGFQTLLSGLLYGEMGSPKRFRDAKAFANGTGLTPAFRESGGKAQSVGITRQGSRLARWALTRAVKSCDRCTKNETGMRVKKWVARQVERGKPKRKAIVAAARKLAEGVWRLLSWGEVFDLKRAFPV
jgi:transposase